MARLNDSETKRLLARVDDSMVIARRLFADLARETADGGGVTRASYSDGEQVAHRMFSACAADIGLEITTDPAGNTYFTLPGSRRDAPQIITGSHLDSVPKGGNYDGAAGVVAGLAALAAIKETGIVPAQDLSAMAVRSEECGSWFGGKHGGHLGSRAALGLMAASELETAVHLGTGKTLGAQMAAIGLDPKALAEGPPYLSRERIKAYIELHIEQGPVLEAKGKPVGIVTGIRGSARARGARCIGEYTHSGAVPQDQRHDAVLAAAELILALEAETQATLAAGGDMVFASGKFYTDPDLHALTKVPGEVRFSLDIRSIDRATLVRMTELAEARAREIGERRGVRFDLSGFAFSWPSVMDDGHRQGLKQGCERLSIDAIDIASGGGHDAQEFERCGIPSSMIFVRNANGSHNARESMEMADFAEGTKLLAWMLAGAL
jgi:N-carbamoyl-L-amino-acid hydrolase